MAPKRRQCAAMQEYERLLEELPSFRANQRRAEEFTARAFTSGDADRVARRLVTIPTVVHVVYKNPKQNISLAQIRSQMAALNKDFRSTNPDVARSPLPGRASSATPRSSSGSPPPIPR